MRGPSRHPRQWEQEKQERRTLGMPHPPWSPRVQGACKPSCQLQGPHPGGSPTQGAGCGAVGHTHIGHPTDGRGYDLHGVHGDFVDHLLLQVPLIKALSVICLETRTKGVSAHGPARACCNLGHGLLTPLRLNAQILGLQGFLDVLPTPLPTARCEPRHWCPERRDGSRIKHGGSKEILP